ncbi:MAG: hypothetical protein IKF72_04085 [Kiritimatiellae bacterium]|nr:hypothetical protein [Kiritimatiellia bacterium]
MDQRLEMTCGIGELKRLLRTKYDFVCSIGPDCGCAGHLIKSRLRRASYPLDWLGTWPLSLTRVAEIVRDEFAGFLKLENIRSIPPPKPVQTPDGVLDDTRHAWCGDDALHIVIPHDFPIDRPIAEAYPEVRRKYDRRIARFYRTIRSSKRVLMVYWTWRTHPTPDDILAAAGIFRAKFPESRVDLLVMRHRDGAGMDVRELSDGVVLMDAPIHPAGLNPAFGDIPFNCRLFGAIRLRGKRRALFREWLQRTAVKAKALFIFDHDKRRAYRQSKRKAKFT